MPAAGDTIAAIATPSGRGGVGVIRISGPAAGSLAESLTGKPLPAPRQAVLRHFLDDRGESLDQGLLLWFPGPASFTGEDVVELQGHGGPVVLSLLLKRVLALGARQAGPGEFSQRAFLNERMDLVQAEAVADLIDAASEAAVRAANRSLSGAFSSAVEDLQERMTHCRMWVESAIDFPEEEIDFLADRQLLALVEALEAQFDQVLAQAREGKVLRDGIRVVLLGLPNAGKSSLLNALAGEAAAIVSDIPGTTRDLVREQILLNGMPVHVIDTAGLRDSGDTIERLGMERALQEARQADLLLEIVDATAPDQRPEIPEAIRRLPSLLLYNKVDLCERPPPGGENALAISARTGEGLQALKDQLYDWASGGHHSGVFSARQRHLDALQRAWGHVQQGSEALRLSGAGELLAEELRLAQQALSEITGRFTADDLLGEIFSSFCIGK